MSRKAAVLGLLTAALAGCGGDAPAEVTGSLTSREREWVASFESWTRGVVVAGARSERVRAAILAGSGTRAGFDRAATPVRACEERFSEHVGDAPSRRLRRVEQLALAGCRALVNVVEAESAAFDGDPGGQLVRADTELARGNELWLRAGRALERLFSWNRPLPLGRANGERSVRDPVLERVAGAVANQPVEVRCWSTRDWPAIVADWRSYGNPVDTPAGFVADRNRGRMNLAPDICGRLAALRRGDRPEGVEARADAAHAVATLAHEAEHVVAPGSEAETECAAMQDVRSTARALGAATEYADELARLFWQVVYPADSPRYRTPYCYSGGPLDRSPGDGRWP
jgi:hypothetical protein